VLKEEEFEAGFFAGLAKDLAFTENISNCADDRNDLVPLNKGVELRGEMRFGGESPGDAQRETDLIAAVAGAACSGEADVIDFRIGTPVGAAGDSDFEFAGEIVELGIAAEFLVEREDEGGNVGDFVSVNSSQGAAGDVAGDVAAGAGGAEADGPEAFEEFWKIFDAYPVELDVLADGDVGNAVAEVVGEIGDGSGLFAGEEAVGDADADHEVGDGFAFAVFAADDASAVALGVNAPRAEVGA